LRLLICWFRGHRWRYDRHVWGSGLDAHDRYVCETCRCDHLEPVAWESDPVSAAAAAAEAAA
jgi:hypothetical protein